MIDHLGSIKTKCDMKLHLVFILMVSASDRLNTAKISEKHTAKQNTFTKMQE